MRRILTCLIAFSFAGRVLAANPPVAEVTKAWPHPNGLVVQVGAADTDFLTGLTADGGRMVHGLTLEPSERDSLRVGLHKAGVYPLASASTWHGAPRLPYADRLVNLLIVDRDVLGEKAPSEEECRRVVAPEGAILARSGGAWKVTAVPRPTAWDNWTHFEGRSDGNALSADREASGINTIQWFNNSRPARWAKRGPAGGWGGNIRVWGRYAVIDDVIGGGTNQKSVIDADHPLMNREDLFCADVNNGLVIWRKQRAKNTSEKRWAIAVGHGRCYTWLEHRQPMVAIDLATGEIRERFPGSEMKPYQATAGSKVQTRDGIRGDEYWVRVGEKTVLANGDGSLRAWSLDGKQLWTYNRPGALAGLPALDEARGVVYVMLAKDDPAPRHFYEPIHYGRWPDSETVIGFAAIDLATGKERWVNTELASRPSGMVHKDKPVTIGWGQLLVAGPHVIVMNTATIGGGNRVFVAAIDAATGKTVHFDPKLFAKGDDPKKVMWDGGLRCAAYRDGNVYIMGSAAYYLYDPVKGTQSLASTLGWNGRCVRPILTPDHLLTGQTAFLGKDHTGVMYASARSGCARSPVPGSGLILFGPHMCHCVTHLDGHFATSSRTVGKPIPDAQRRVTEKPSGIPVPGPTATIKDTLVTENWRWFTFTQPVIAKTTEQDGWSFRVDPSAHRIDATGPNKKSWSYLAESRIGVNIVVTADRVVVGSHDGWVHGLDRATGTLVWKYLLAPSHRLIVANNMLTSTWPVFGVADMGNGMVVASAGLHAEHEGGIRVAALRASDGNVDWLKTLTKPPSPIAAGKGPHGIVDRSVINGVPSFVDGKVRIESVEKHMGRVEFAPDEDEAAINKRLSSPAKLLLPKG